MFGCLCVVGDGPMAAWNVPPSVNYCPLTQFTFPGSTAYEYWDCGESWNVIECATPPNIPLKAPFLSAVLFLHELTFIFIPFLSSFLIPNFHKEI